MLSSSLSKSLMTYTRSEPLTVDFLLFLDDEMTEPRTLLPILGPFLIFFDLLLFPSSTRYKWISLRCSSDNLKSFMLREDPASSLKSDSCVGWVLIMCFKYSRWFWLSLSNSFLLLPRPLGPPNGGLPPKIELYIDLMTVCCFRMYELTRPSFLMDLLPYSLPPKWTRFSTSFWRLMTSLLSTWIFCSKIRLTQVILTFSAFNS